MLEIKIYDGNEDPLGVKINNEEDDFLRALNGSPELILLHDEDSGINFAVPVRQYIISWKEIDE